MSRGSVSLREPKRTQCSKCANTHTQAKTERVWASDRKRRPPRCHEAQHSRVSPRNRRTVSKQSKAKTYEHAADGSTTDVRRESEAASPPASHIPHATARRRNHLKIAFRRSATPRYNIGNRCPRWSPIRIEEPKSTNSMHSNRGKISYRSRAWTRGARL